MALTINNTPGAADANSYIDLAEADEILAGFGSWDDLTTEQKISVLIQAASLMDGFSFVGDKYDATQGMEFPRDFQVEDPANMTVPQSVKFEQARFALKVAMEAAGNDRITEVDLNEFRLKLASDLSGPVFRFINRWVDKERVVTG